MARGRSSATVEAMHELGRLLVGEPQRLGQAEAARRRQDEVHGRGQVDALADGDVDRLDCLTRTQGTADDLPFVNQIGASTPGEGQASVSADEQ